MTALPLHFQVQDLLWLYIPLIKDIKERQEDSGERPFLVVATNHGFYELATMTEHYKKPDYQYQIQYETNPEFQGKTINYNTKVHLTEEVLQQIMGKIFLYYKPYQLNSKDFAIFKNKQLNYFTDPKWIGQRYQVRII